VLGLDTLHDLPLERALSQIADWVLECERHGDSYALDLRQREVAAGHGLAQRRKCLEALALYESS
jgi:hypothetical protein